MDIPGRSAVVTGAAGGIGAALAEELLGRGASVVLADRDAERLRGAVERLRPRHGGRVLGFAGDAGSPLGLRALVNHAEVAHGPVDLFVANAGVPGTPDLGEPEDWEAALHVNLMAHVHAARLLVPQWLERGGGYFASTASAAGLLTQLGSATYSVSKHAAVAFAEWLAVTYGDRGVGVSCLCPMGVDTGMLNAGRQSPDPAERLMAQAVVEAGEVLGARDVAVMFVDAVVSERFLVLSHPSVHRMLQQKSADADRWIMGMRRYSASLQRRHTDT